MWCPCVLAKKGTVLLAARYSFPHSCSLGSHLFSVTLTFLHLFLQGSAWFRKGFNIYKELVLISKKKDSEVLRLQD